MKLRDQKQLELWINIRSASDGILAPLTRHLAIPNPSKTLCGLRLNLGHAFVPARVYNSKKLCAACQRIAEKHGLMNIDQTFNIELLLPAKNDLPISALL